MRKLILSLAMASAVCAVAMTVTGAYAQHKTDVPDQMPFDIPFGNSITADHAAKVVQAVIAEAKKPGRNWKFAITVVDPSGELVYFYKMDGTQAASVGISQGKARTAARYRRASGIFFNIANSPNGAWVGTLDPQLVASHGGFPLIEGGKLIGAVGCSGATGDQDGVACKVGADTVK